MRFSASNLLFLRVLFQARSSSVGQLKLTLFIVDIPVHRVIISNRSDYFNDLFAFDSIQTSTCSTGIVSKREKYYLELDFEQDVKPFKDLLRSIYKGLHRPPNSLDLKTDWIAMIGLAFKFNLAGFAQDLISKRLAQEDAIKSLDYTLDQWSALIVDFVLLMTSFPLDQGNTILDNLLDRCVENCAVELTAVCNDLKVSTTFTSFNKYLAILCTLQASRESSKCIAIQKSHVDLLISIVDYKGWEKRQLEWALADGIIDASLLTKEIQVNYPNHLLKPTTLNDHSKRRRNLFDPDTTLMPGDVRLHVEDNLERSSTVRRVRPLPPNDQQQQHSVVQKLTSVASLRLTQHNIINNNDIQNEYRHERRGSAETIPETSIWFQSQPVVQSRSSVDIIAPKPRRSMDVPDFVKEDSLVDQYSIHEREKKRQSSAYSSLYVSSFIKGAIPPIEQLGNNRSLTYQDWSGDTHTGVIEERDMMTPKAENFGTDNTHMHYSGGAQSQFSSSSTLGGAHATFILDSLNNAPSSGRDSGHYNPLPALPDHSKSQSSTMYRKPSIKMFFKSRRSSQRSLGPQQQQNYIPNHSRAMRTYDLEKQERTSWIGGQEDQEYAGDLENGSRKSPKFNSFVGFLKGLF